MDNNQSPKTYYSFMNLLRCVDRNNNPYVGVILSGRFFNADTATKQTQSGKDVIRCSMGIQNRDKAITEMFGMCPPPDDKGTVWARVSFFGNAATRFASFVAKYPDAEIVISGSMRVEPSQGKDGRTYTNINIAVSDFTAPNLNRRTTPAQTTNAYGTYTAPAQAQAPAWGQQGNQPPQNNQPAQSPAGWGGQPQSNNGFVEIDDDDSDLPF